MITLKRNKFEYIIPVLLALVNTVAPENFKIPFPYKDKARFRIDDLFDGANNPAGTYLEISIK